MAYFDVTVVDDHELDGTQAAAIWANIAGEPEEGWLLDVHDNETATLYLDLPAGTAAEGDAPMTATLRLDGSITTDLVVNVASSDETEATVPATITIPAGMLEWDFPITIVDDGAIDFLQTTQISVAAADWAGAAAMLNVKDNESQKITLGLGVYSVTEGDGYYVCGVTISGTWPVDLDITLSIDNPSGVDQITVDPVTVTIPAGMTWTEFNLGVVDDNIFDGEQTVTVNASADGWTSDAWELTVADNEPFDIYLDLDVYEVSEGDGPVSAVVSVPGIVMEDLTIELWSDNPYEATVPDSVVILAGESMASFDVTVVDDDRVDGTQWANISAGSYGWMGDFQTLTVHDNDPRVLLLDLEPSMATEGGENVSGLVLITYEYLQDLTVSLVSSDLDEASVPASVVIPAGELSAPFEITVGDDTLIDETQTVTITASAISGDLSWNRRKPFLPRSWTTNPRPSISRSTFKDRSSPRAMRPSRVESRSSANTSPIWKSRSTPAIQAK